MATLYHCEMSDGSKVSVECCSAADAIQEALLKRRSLTVSACWRGDGEARINYDVPAHKQLGPKIKANNKKAQTTSMFDEKQILSESRKALFRANK